MRLRGVEAAATRARARRCASRRAPARARSARRSALGATGTMAGARSPRGKSLPTACIDGQRRRARREGEDASSRAVRAGERRRARARMSAALVVDQRVHRDDVVEAPERRVEHVADAEVDAAAAEVRRRCARARARPASATGRWRPRRRRAAPPRPPARPCRSRRRAARAPRRSRGSQSSSVARIRSRPARTVARMRLDRRVGGQPLPGLDRRAVEIGLELAAALDVGGASASVEPQEVEDLAVLHRRARRAARRRPRAASASRMYSCCTASISGRVLHLEQRRLLQAAAADRVEVGEVRHALQADARR